MIKIVKEPILELQADKEKEQNPAFQKDALECKY